MQLIRPDFHFARAARASDKAKAAKAAPGVQVARSEIEQNRTKLTTRFSDSSESSSAEISGRRFSTLQKPNG